MGSASSSSSGGLKAAVAAVIGLALVAALLVVVVFDDNPCSTLSAPADGSVPQPTGSGPRLDVRVATWNVYYFTSAAQTAAGLRDLADQADVIGLQEYGPSKKQRALSRSLPAGFSAYTTDNNMTGVVWRHTAFDLVGRGVERSFGVERVESGASGTVLGPRSVLWVQLRQRSTGAVFTLLNTHIVPTIDLAGHPDTSKPARLRLYSGQVDQVGRLTARFRPNGPVFVTGDFNIDAAADAKVKDPSWPYVAMQRFGLYSNWRALGYPRQGTHEGGRLIDYVWESASTVALTAQRILPAHGSDHNPVVVTATNQPPARAVVAAAGAAGSTVPASSSAAAPPTSEPPTAVPTSLQVPGPLGRTLTLTGEQLGNAAVIIAEAKAHAIPAYGSVVAIAAALQESGLRALGYGDRDSQGLFQQRPSSGWGTVAQVRDPHLSSQAFYGVASHTHNPGLVDVKGWQSMTVTQAAQAVQRSAFPEAYAKWQPAAEAIAKALTGTTVTSPAGSGCTDDGGGLPGSCPATGSPAEKGLTPDAMRVLRCGQAQFPRLRTFYGVGERPSTTDDDHQTGRAVDLMISDVFPDYKGAAGSAYGWQVAEWMRAHHTELGIHYVIFAARIWNLDRDSEGWRPYGGVTGGNDDTSLHYDHVHVSVFGTRGTGLAAAAAGGARVAPGRWTMPLPAGAYRVGCGFSCYPGHTGQDFPAHSGTPVYATSGGTVIRSLALRSGGQYVSYGNLVVIRSAGSTSTEVFYAHLKTRLVTTGQAVRAGQQIGLSGYTGHVIPQGEGGAHLHFEIRVGGTPVDPLPLLTQHGVTP